MAEECRPETRTVGKAAVEAVWGGPSVAVTGVRGTWAGPRSGVRAERCSAAAIGMAKAASKWSGGLGEGLMRPGQEERALQLGVRGAG